MQTLYNELGKYFDLIAAASAVDTEKEVAFLKTVFAEYDVRSVLDIACGTGRHSVALAKSGYDVIGIDYSERLLEVARSKARRLSGVRFLRQDVSGIKPGQQFDAAICMWSTFGELPYRKMLGRLKAVLKPGGLFVIDSGYFPKLPTGSTRTVNKLKAKNVNITTEIQSIYSGKTRILEIIYDVDGKIVKDHSEMDMLTEADCVARRVPV